MTLRMPLAAATAVTLLLCISMSRQCNAQEFIWGTATSSYQIEGAWDVDGKGWSIWDEFVRRNGTTIKDNSTGDIACRSYEKYKEDVQLLKQLGVTGYRFSISWPRVLPNGTLAGGINQKGIDYYVNLVDELLANGIQPMATLYHWDLPLTLQNEFQGWESEKIIPHFVDYAKLMYEKLGDKVKWWITFNEPWIFNVLGNGLGNHAPGKKDLVNTVYIVAHNVLRAHAKAYRIYETEFKATQKGKVGITLNGAFVLPKDPNSEADKQAAQRSMEFTFGWYADPVYFGDYPEEMKNRVYNKSIASGLTNSRLPEFTPDEKTELKGTSDFFGLNYYTSSIAEHKILSNDGGYMDDQDLVSSLDPSWPGSGSIWLKVTPFGIRKGIQWLSDRYDKPPIVVTENGVSDNSGTTTDQHRIDFYREYIGNVTQGAEVSILSSDIWTSMGCPALKNSHRRLQAHDGHQLKVLGALAATIEFRNRLHPANLTVVSSTKEFGLLGRDLLDADQLFCVTTTTKATQPVEKLPVIRGHKARMTLVEGATPKFFRERPVPIALESAVRLN